MVVKDYSIINIVEIDYVKQTPVYPINYKHMVTHMYKLARIKRWNVKYSFE